MSMHFYLSRTDQKLLRDKLNELPRLVEELTITETRQGRIIRPGLGKLKHQRPRSEWPFNIDAAAADTELHRCLAGWVKVVCDHRKIRYDGSRSTLSYGNWIKRNLTTLALIDGSQDAYEDIAGRILDAWNVIDPANEDVHTNARRVANAEQQVVTVGQVELISSQLGGRQITARRVRKLNETGRLQPVRVDPYTGTKFYRLGDVFAAHDACPQRRRTRATHPGVLGA